MEENKVTAEERLIGIISACDIKTSTGYTHYEHDDEIIVEQDIRRKTFYCSYGKIWKVLESEYKMEDNDIREMVNMILQKHIEVDKYTTRFARKIQATILESV